jgi:hypothetical protein
VHGVYSPLRAQGLALLALAYAGWLTANAETRATAAVDFSGRWVLVSATPVRPGYEQFWLGTEATITQTPSSLSVRRLTPLPQRDARFALDRDESQNEYVVNGQRLTRNSRTTWNGNTLLISTDTALPDGRTYLSNILRWSLDADGMLVIGDTEICGRGECPSVLTTVKFNPRGFAPRTPLHSLSLARGAGICLPGPFGCTRYF